MVFILISNLLNDYVLYLKKSMTFRVSDAMRWCKKSVSEGFKIESLERAGNGRCLEGREIRREYTRSFKSSSINFFLSSRLSIHLELR